MIAFIYQLTLSIHILFGCLALATLLIPFLCKKGSRWHRQFGRCFVFSMLSVGWTGLIIAIWVMVMPELLFESLVNATPEQAQILQDRAFGFSVFFICLVAIVLVSTRYGINVLRVKKNRELLRTSMYRWELCLPACAGAISLYFGIDTNQTVMMVFGILGFIVSSSSLFYIFKPVQNEREWIIEHFSALTGSAIACVTAFTVLGGARFLGVAEELRFFSWVGPGILGVLFTFWGTYYYRRKFNVNTSHLSLNNHIE